MFELQKFIEDFFIYPSPCHKTAWQKVFDDMAVHTRKRKPEELLLKIRPNEEPDIFQYRLDNYRPITYGSMNKAFDSLNRIFSNINYSIKCSNELGAYIKTNSFNENDFETWLQKQVLKYDIEDPNGFIVWFPTGEGLVSSSVKVLPKPLLVHSFQLHYKDDEVFSFLSHEKSKIRDGKQDVMDGDVYWIFTKTEFGKLIQKGKKKDNDFDYVKIYSHNIGKIPVVTCGGDMSAAGFFESFFSPYLAFGDEAISQFSDWQAIMKTSTFPYIEDFAVDCEINTDYRSNNPIVDGEEKYPNKGEVKDLKPIAKSPYNIRLRRIPNGTSDMDQILDVNVPSRRYIHPDVNIAKYSGESWERLIEMAEDALHLYDTGTNQSAVAKDRDLEDKYAMISKIANNFFDNIMYNSLVFMEKYLNPKEKNVVVIVKPNSMRVKNESDIIEEIGALDQKKIPGIFVSATTRELATKRFGNDPLNKKIFELISIIDPLYIYSPEQRNQFVLSGTIDKPLAVKSVFVYPLLLDIAREIGEESFLKSDVDIIKAKFEEKVAPLLPAPQEPLFDENGNEE